MREKMRSTKVQLTLSMMALTMNGILIAKAAPTTAPIIAVIAQHLELQQLQQPFSFPAVFLFFAICGKCNDPDCLSADIKYYNNKAVSLMQLLCAMFNE